MKKCRKMIWDLEGAISMALFFQHGVLTDTDLPWTEALGLSLSDAHNTFKPCSDHDTYWLVVWNMNFVFPYIGNLIIPTDFHIFLTGRYTTNQHMLKIVEES